MQWKIEITRERKKTFSEDMQCKEKLELKIQQKDNRSRQPRHIPCGFSLSLSVAIRLKNRSDGEWRETDHRQQTNWVSEMLAVGPKGAKTTFWYEGYGLGAIHFRLDGSSDVGWAVAAVVAWATASDIEWIGTGDECWLALFIISSLDFGLIASS